MSFGGTLIALAISQSAPGIIASQSFELGGHQATLVEMVERPRGLADEAFARRLIEESGLIPWDGELFGTPPTSGRMGVASVISGAGRQVTVYFIGGDPRRPGRVCRITRERGGMTPAWESAQDWCASRFGLPPIKRQPPITGSTKHPPR